MIMPKVSQSCLGMSANGTIAFNITKEIVVVVA
jgi:hypothetical protein